jgi:S-DNA-T family DNA segregation ATPase FtsK/SpoIIIE
MSKRKNRQQILHYELLGIGLLALSALALGRLGVVGRYLDVAFIYLAGSWSFLVPIFIGYAAIYMMWQRTPFPWHSRHMGLLVLFVTWLTAMEMDFYQGLTRYYPPGQVPLFQATLNAIKDMCALVLEQPGASVSGGAGGGLIGYVVFALSLYLFSFLGTYVVLAVGVLVGGALVTQQSLVAGVKRGTRWMEQVLDSMWKGAQQYLKLLFGPEDNARQRRGSGGGKGRNGGRKAPPSPPALVVDGEVVGEAPEPPADDHMPIVHDFTHAVRSEQAGGESTDRPEGPIMEQSGSQLILKFPDRPSTPIKDPPPKRKTADGSYPVGPMVRDEHYQLPPIRMFALPEPRRGGFDQRSAQENARKLEATLESFGVQAKVLEISRGPTVTRYEVQPAVGVKVSKIVGLTDDIALALAARDIRIEAPVPGKSVIGIEIPNPEVAVVTLREVLESPEFQQEESKLALALGRDISGQAIVGNLQKMPHLLVAGATGSGKSVCINCMIASILVKAKPHEVKLMMIDPKMVELSGYNGIPHLLAPVVTDPRKAAYALKKVVQEMEQRYQAFAERGARDIERYNQMLRSEGADPLPYIVVIIDELADLMMVAPGEVEDAICRIAQMARAAGIHLIVATQRPSVDVITGLIKANIPSRIAFAVSSMADSRTILDMGGAEKLLGRGDMLYLPVGASKPVRVQGAYVSEAEIDRLVEYVKAQQQAVYTVDLTQAEETSEEAASSDLDDLFADAVDLVVDAGQASVSMIQRRFRVGYARAARIIDQMEQQGLVGPFEGSKPREVLVSREQWLAMRSAFERGTSGNE